MHSYVETNITFIIKERENNMTEQNTEFGFASEPRSNKRWVSSPASKDNGSVTVHDLSGFCGSWGMREGGVFFPSETGETLCPAASDKASSYSYDMNKPLRDKEDELEMMFKEYRESLNKGVATNSSDMKVSIKGVVGKGFSSEPVMITKNLGEK